MDRDEENYYGKHGNLLAFLEQFKIPDLNLTYFNCVISMDLNGLECRLKWFPVTSIISNIVIFSCMSFASLFKLHIKGKFYMCILSIFTLGK